MRSHVQDGLYMASPALCPASNRSISEGADATVRREVLNPAGKRLFAWQKTENSDWYELGVY